ncbi:MAG: hypothetical protein NTW94_06165 [Legionellales bacterium]|nr:hypothetical protein [Legionellales bacterium]
MRSHLMNHKLACLFIFLLSLLTCSVGNAWRGGGGGDFHGGGGYNHGAYNYHGGDNYHNNDYYHGGNYYGGAAVVGVPIIGGYYGSSCSNVQQCDQNGNCVQQQVCN